ncbi:hypothetical protein B0A89_14465 (plasmid) [Paracoccus contaminans]|uniref:Uncharacterized protein n=2 Tax=Paracoccus contaminans TaxID=1945662 RepID=A0A1W6D1K6_9RHOB|nr:hypothetical protein B0A89_14465 [Paracoccus contaminans]
MATQAVHARGGQTMASPDHNANSISMAQQALRLDAGAVLRANPGLEPQIVRMASGMTPAMRADLWSVAAERGVTDPAQSERLSTALFMFEDGSGAATAEGRHRIAQALANARRPGEGDADRVARDQTVRNIEAVLEHPDARAMLFGQQTTPELRVWALEQVAGDGACINADAFKNGWESEAISRAYAGRVTDAFQARGTEPQHLQKEALRNTVGQAMGIAPDMLPAGTPSAEFLERGLNNSFYSASERNKPINDVAEKITQIGGPDARVTVVPVTVTSKDEGAATVPVFRVESPTGGEAQFVDHTGRTYRDLADWERSNTLPEGKMTYAAGLDLHSDTLTHRNTPGVVDSFGEGFGKVMDGVALGVGIVAAGALIVGTGGTAAPLVAAGAAGLWTAGRAAQGLHDQAAHGQDIGDLSDPAVRANWLEIAAGALSVGAIGGGLALAGRGAQASPALARAVSGTALAADLADGVAIGDQSLQLAQNWDAMSGKDRAAALLNIAFWGGMGVAAHRAGAGQNGADGMSFAGLDMRLRSGRPFDASAIPVSADPALAPGEMRLAYDVSGGRATGIRIEHGPGTPDPAQLALHQRTAVQLAEAGSLRHKLNGLLTGRPTPPVGSAAHEATLELDKIQREAQSIGEALARAGSPAERDALAIRQRELDQALTRESQRLNAPEAAGNGFVGAPRSLNELLTYYGGRGDITPGVPANMAPLTAPAANAAAHVDYGPLNAAGQAQGIEATITAAMLDTGGKADPDVRPPGFVNGSMNHSRGHLLARMMGGSGTDPRNFVMLYQRNTNSPVMRDFEQTVYDAVKAGEVVNYKVTPIYDASQPHPVSVALQARGSQGLDIAITILNRDGS